MKNCSRRSGGVSSPYVRPRLLLASALYPRGIPLGVVSSVSQTDTDIYKKVQVDPYVDFANLEAVIILIPQLGTK